MHSPAGQLGKRSGLASLDLTEPFAKIAISQQPTANSQQPSAISSDCELSDSPFEPMADGRWLLADG
jgi:hypothetical protein